VQTTKTTVNDQVEDYEPLLEPDTVLIADQHPVGREGLQR